ncbi:MAG TPA: GNAT family N-acetyltransferase [Pyrinomonadaceae bacterium]|jgi:RimJ/RimL family protein N-acetyltransferase
MSQISDTENDLLTVLETERLRLRRLIVEDAEFIVRLLNEPAFLQYIGDRGVRTLADARAYLMQGPLASYEKFGFGLYLIELRAARVPVGICGLLRRDVLDDADIGYALVSEFRGQGYAREAAAAVVAYARDALGLARLAAVVDPDNHVSIRLLERLGFRYERPVSLADDAAPIKLFTTDL